MSPRAFDDNEREDLVAFLDGELDKAERQEVEAKIQVDPDARAEAESLRKTWDLLDFLPKVEPDQSFTQRTLDKIAPLVRPDQVEKPKRSRLFWGALWATSLLVAVCLGYVGYDRLRPQEPDVREMVRNLRVIENLPMYEDVEDLDFLRKLDDPELFGEEGS